MSEFTAWLQRRAAERHSVVGRKFNLVLVDEQPIYIIREKKWTRPVLGSMKALIGPKPMIDSMGQEYRVVG